MNKCGFKIVEFFNKHHRDPFRAEPTCLDGKPVPEAVAFFRFKKETGKN